MTLRGVSLIDGCFKMYILYKGNVNKFNIFEVFYKGGCIYNGAVCVIWLNHNEYDVSL